MNPFRFATPLVEGIIEKRKSQFTMTVNYEGQSVACHAIPAPDLGRGDIFFCNRIRHISTVSQSIISIAKRNTSPHLLVFLFPLADTLTKETKECTRREN